MSLLCHELTRGFLCRVSGWLEKGLVIMGKMCGTGCENHFVAQGEAGTAIGTVSGAANGLYGIMSVMAGWFLLLTLDDKSKANDKNSCERVCCLWYFVRLLIPSSVFRVHKKVWVLSANGKMRGSYQENYPFGPEGCVREAGLLLDIERGKRFGR